MILDFLSDFNEETSPYGRHRKYGETLVKYRIIEPDTFRVQNIISFDPCSFNAFGKMLCRLADKHGITISGKATPTMVGPSITKTNKIYLGLDQNRLLKLYKKFGFDIQEDSNGYQVVRSPR